MIHRLFGLLLFFSAASSFFRADAAATLVPLKTEGAVQKLYVGSFVTQKASLPPSYAKSLRSVLVFDIGHNGSSIVKPQEAKTEEALHSKTPFLPLFWKKKAIDFVVKATLDRHALCVTLFSAKTGLKIAFPPRTLHGTLSIDRRIVHQIADEMCEEITGKRGIASTKILYAVKRLTEEKTLSKPLSEIWETDYDGHNQRQITAEESYCISPSYFPTSGTFTRNRFFYVNYKKGPSKIYSAVFSEPKGKPLLALRGNQLLPAISRQGHLLAFISDASGRADLFLQPISATYGPVGKPIQAYSFPYSVQSSPTFSPDGKTLAFVSNKEGSPRIYLLDTPYPKRGKKSAPLCITKKYRENTSPCWSPDGTKLAYSAKIKGIRQIMIYDFITREEIQITEGTDHKEYPSFAPNSLHLVFQTVDSSSELFVLHLKQRKTVQITKGGGGAHYPRWGFYPQK